MEHERSQHHGTEHCRYHVVCCPKDRRKVVVPPIDARLKTRRVEETARWGQELIAWEGMPDQVQVLVGCDPQFGLHRVVKRRKGFCSHALRESCVARGVSRGHAAAALPVDQQLLRGATVGGVPLETRKRDVEGQEGC